MGYLCERISFLSLLKLKHPNMDDDVPKHHGMGDYVKPEPSWTAWDVCEGKGAPLLYLLKHRAI